MRQHPEGGALQFQEIRSVMKTFLSWAIAALLVLSFVSFANAQQYTQVNLVANTPGLATVTDPNLVNPWGISRTSSSPCGIL